ncbi:MAG: hypothetical protein M3R07_04645, partial [Gemmatimonadota bacterium]|nr:hypothetical protein [Gemmatimonadota bacterium]
SDARSAALQRRMNEVGERVVEDVRKGLISPSSAQFSGVYVQHIESKDVYSVSGTVDSQNVYGAMLRDSFQRYLRYTGSGWTDITGSLSHEQTMDLLKAATSQLKATNRG